MHDPSDGETDAGLTPVTAFALLGEPTRLAILRAVWEAPTGAVSFSDLRDRVGVEDTGRFNYHLGKLRGHFVRKRDGGYELRQAGVEVVRAVLAGVINEAPVREPTPFGASCPDCDGTLLASYDGHGTVACDECETVWMHNEFPPAGLSGRDAAALARALDRWTRHRSLLAFEGVCPSCASETTTTVEETERGQFVDRICGHCEHVSRAPLWALVVYDPDVSRVLREDGVVVRDRPFWELVRLSDGAERTDDGFVVRLVTDEGPLQVVLDADLGVERVVRER
jgi:DNA-binding transcriptional ArsR family regulator